MLDPPSPLAWRNLWLLHLNLEIRIAVRVTLITTLVTILLGHLFA